MQRVAEEHACSRSRACVSVDIDESQSTENYAPDASLPSIAKAMVREL